MADKPKTPLEKVVQTAIDSALKEVHTCLPAVVTKVDHTEQLIEAQCTIKRKMGGELVNLPLLTEVPVRYFKSNTFSITFPIEVGDHVLIIFAERSIDTWLENGGLQNPYDVRKHSLSDAFALPLMYPQIDKIPSFSSSNLEIKTNTGNTKVIVKESEDVEINTTGEIKGECATIVINATTSGTITTPILTLNGNLQVNGTIVSNTSVTAPLLSALTSLLIQSKQMHNHVHSQGNDSDGDSQQNTNAPV